jgi:hypothetical protein
MKSNQDQPPVNYSPEYMDAMEQRMAEQEMLGGVQQSEPIEDSVAKWELDTKEEIERIERTLLGFEMIDNKWIRKKNSKQEEIKPQLTEEGLNTLMMPIKALVGKITALSDVNDKMINKTCKELRINFAKLIAEKRRIWDIDRSNQSSLVLVLDNLLFSSLSKAKNAMMVRSRQKNIQERRVILNDRNNNDFGPPRKRGFNI